MTRLERALAPYATARIRAATEERIRRKAAAAGLDVEAFLELAEREQAARAELFRLRHDRGVQLGVLAAHAAHRGRRLAFFRLVRR